jgi:hypothetical protein
MSKGPCVFWSKGKCKNGNSCKFYHDPVFNQMQINKKANKEEKQEVPTSIEHAWHSLTTAHDVLEDGSAGNALPRRRKGPDPKLMSEPIILTQMQQGK